MSDEVLDLANELASAMRLREKGTCCANCELAPAFVAWNAGLLYIDNRGNYHLRDKPTGHGPIAPWNRDIKRLFADVDTFHRAAGLGL